jgi:hypothetical protein
LRTLGQEKKEH